MEKESFILYNSFYESIKSLKNEQLGKLLRAIFNYTINGEITQDNEILIAFMFIKNQIDIDAKKWEEIKQKRSEAGRLGGINRAINKKQILSSKSKQRLTELSNAKQSQANQAVNVNDNVNVNVNDNVINKKRNIKEKKSYGEFNNVLLTDEEYAKLEKSNLLPYIETLSSYIASKGKKYKSHYATILTWSRNDKKNKVEEEYKGLSFRERENRRQLELLKNIKDD